MCLILSVLSALWFGSILINKEFFCNLATALSWFAVCGPIVIVYYIWTWNVPQSLLSVKVWLLGLALGRWYAAIRDGHVCSDGKVVRLPRDHNGHM